MSIINKSDQVESCLDSKIKKKGQQFCMYCFKNLDERW